MRTLLLLFTSFVLIAVSCTKDKVITSKNAFLLASDTALHFDTVFTSVGSVTKQLKLFNINNQKLSISNLQLMGGDRSFFKINVSGTAGTQFSNVTLEKGDSLYVFVSLSVNSSMANLPFLIEDSIRVDYNGNTQFIKLDGFGQNAHFLRHTILKENTTWKADLPYILLDTFAVPVGITLTIEKGTQIYCHANTPFTVAGSLHVDGTADSMGHVVFQNDRLDAPYKDEPGTWDGIYFTANSRNNILNGVTIRNALQGIAADTTSSFVLNNCRIENCASVGLITYNSTVSATNCLFANSSYNVYCSAGGTYSFANCTLASYSTQYLFHQTPALTIGNMNNDGTDLHPLQALFQNCIVWGEEGSVTDEVATLNNSNASFAAHFENTLFKSPAENPSITYSDCLVNVDPEFEMIDAVDKIYDFHLSTISPCINKGINIGTTMDLDGINRTGLPDLGCYEFH